MYNKKGFKLIISTPGESCEIMGSTKTWNPETEYGIRERRFQAIDLKKNVSNDNKITQQIKKEGIDE